jgi:2,3,4,5-tetrahydropyridine-2-carboxylate N-succinyltransferase
MDDTSEQDRVLIEAAFADRARLKDAAHVAAVERTLARLDRGELRVASPPAAPEGDELGEWTTHAWTKQAILLYFAIRGMETTLVGPFEFHDKIPLKKGLAKQNVRVVPPGVIRYGAFCEPGVIVMPGYVNIGARVGAGSMVDTWATVGSCAQIGKNCHLSGGVGIGGVLEPLQANPVIVEDNCFIGARSEVVEGVIVGTGSVLSMGVFISANTRIVDRETGQIHIGKVPPYSVVHPGTMGGGPDKPARYCVIITKIVDERTRSKTSINELLRD